MIQKSTCIADFSQWFRTFMREKGYDFEETMIKFTNDRGEWNLLPLSFFAEYCEKLPLLVQDQLISDILTSESTDKGIMGFLANLTKEGRIGAYYEQEMKPTSEEFDVIHAKLVKVMKYVIILGKEEFWTDPAYLRMRGDNHFFESAEEKKELKKFKQWAFLIKWKQYLMILNFFNRPPCKNAEYIIKKVVKFYNKNYINGWLNNYITSHLITSINAQVKGSRLKAAEPNVSKCLLNWLREVDPYFL